MPPKLDCNHKKWKDWRNLYKPQLNNLGMPYDEIDYYNTYLGKAVYDQEGRSISSKSNCPQY